MGYLRKAHTRLQTQLDTSGKVQILNLLKLFSKEDRDRVQRALEAAGLPSGKVSDCKAFQDLEGSQTTFSCLDRHPPPFQLPLPLLLQLLLYFNGKERTPINLHTPHRRKTGNDRRTVYGLFE